MSFDSLLPLTFNVREVEVLARSASIDGLLQNNGSCYCELMPAVGSPTAAAGYEFLFHSEIDPPTEYFKEIKFDEVLLFKLEGAYVLPAFGIIISADGHVLTTASAEGLCLTPDLVGTGLVERRLEGLFLRLQNIQSIGPVAFPIPWGGTHNYGHFILDGISSVEMMFNAGLHRHFVFGSPSFNEWSHSHWARIGISPYLMPAPAYRIEKLVYTSAMNHFLHKAHYCYKGVRDRYLFGMRRNISPRNIYVSRESRSNRKLACEQDLQRELSRFGFFIIDPDLLSLETQIEYFNNANVVIGSAGAALASVLFCQPGTFVLEIQPVEMASDWVRRIGFVVGLRCATYMCTTLHKGENFLHDLTYNIDIDRFISFLCDHTGWSR